MQVEVNLGSIAENRTDAIAVGIFQAGAVDPTGPSAEVDRALGGQIGRLMASSAITGKEDEITVLYPDGANTPPRVIVAGLGNKERLSPETLRRVSASIAQKARETGAESLATSVGSCGAGLMSPFVAWEAVVQGTITGLYRFWDLKTDRPDRLGVKRLIVVEANPADMPSVSAGADSGRIIAESISFARNLANLPANILTPSALAEMAANMAGISGLSSRVMEETQIAGLGMNAMLSVAKGSHQPPRFLVLEHNAGRSDYKTVVLVGKAVTFDSGGISLKPSDGMENMKGDMAGGAAVIGAMRACALLRLPLHVIGLVPAVENMPGGGASRPGDVVKAMKGISIEVISTDAEGRMILADGLTYAGIFKPQAVIDIATLTGACGVALGSGAAGAMGDEGLIGILKAAGDQMGERVWPLPLFPEYEAQIKSDIADIKNSGGRPAGALTAGCFLQKFVPEGVPWVHIDMAGMARDAKGKPHSPPGATGYGVGLFAEFLRRYSNG